MKKNILIITSTYDMTVDYIIDKYGEEHRFYRVNVDMFHTYQFCISHSGWEIKTKNWVIDSNTIYSIYYRKPSLPNLNEYDPIYINMINKDIMRIIDGIVETHKGKCLTKPSILRRCENKIYQLSLANEIGFNVPETLISNSDYAVNDFAFNEMKIIKPLSVGRIILDNEIIYMQTHILNDELPIVGIENTPLYLQKYIDKDYELRVTFIEDDVYAVKITSSDDIDWRRGENKYSLYEIPKEIYDLCLMYMKLLDLKFGAFDFIVSRGRYVFLEINPNGQWLWLEEELGLDISSKLIEYLGSK